MFSIRTQVISLSFKLPRSRSMLAIVLAVHVILTGSPALFKIAFVDSGPVAVVTGLCIPCR